MLDALRGGSGLNALLVLEGSLMGRKQEADPEAHAERTLCDGRRRKSMIKIMNLEMS